MTVDQLRKFLATEGIPSDAEVFIEIELPDRSSDEGVTYRDFTEVTEVGFMSSGRLVLHGSLVNPD